MQQLPRPRLAFRDETSIALRVPGSVRGGDLLHVRWRNAKTGKTGSYAVPIPYQASDMQFKIRNLVPDTAYLVAMRVEGCAAWSQSRYATSPCKDLSAPRIRRAKPLKAPRVGAHSGTALKAADTHACADREAAMARAVEAAAADYRATVELLKPKEATVEHYAEDAADEDQALVEQLMQLLQPAAAEPAEATDDDDAFVCPITLERFQDPVVASDGFTYERSAIVAWIAKDGTSPQTREPLDPKCLVPNRLVVSLLAQEL